MQSWFPKNWVECPVETELEKLPLQMPRLNPLSQSPHLWPRSNLTPIRESKIMAFIQKKILGHAIQTNICEIIYHKLYHKFIKNLSETMSCFLIKRSITTYSET